ncbi:unnamed protein product, partial [Rotaria socialis]
KQCVTTTTVYLSVAAWWHTAPPAEPRPTLASVYTVASTFSHHGVQYVNFGCSCFTGDANSSLHDAGTILHDVARRLGDATSISGDFASISDDATCIPGDNAKIPWYR